MKTDSLYISNILVSDRLRGLDEAAVCRLVESIGKIGLRTPITVRWADDDAEKAWQTVLIAGRHRLEACRRLGMEEIEVIITTGSSVNDRLWEIAENLDRAELTKLERGQHIAEWIRLTDDKRADQGEEVLAQHGPKPLSGRPEGGLRAAVRELGVGRTEAQRAVQVDSLAPEAKDAARAVGLDDNQTALLAAAREPTAEKQVAALQNYKPRKSAQVKAIDNKATKPTTAIHTEVDELAWRKSIIDVWNKAPQGWRRTALEIMGSSIDAEAA